MVAETRHPVWSKWLAEGRSSVGGWLARARGQPAAPKPYRLKLMAPPAFLEADDVTPFSDPELVTAGGDPQILYATLREPAGSEGGDPFYSSLRAGDVRVGLARIELGAGDITWDEARRMSILKNNTDRYPLQVAEVNELGTLDCVVSPMASAECRHLSARKRFAELIDARLERSRDRDVFIYVHGYRVNFENPVLVAAELWHFIGYQGVFIPFAWPARRGRLAYFGDTESSLYGAPYLREFMRYLARETQVRAIHVVGYSAGTRLVAAAMYQLGLLHQHRTEQEIERELKLGDVILVASDVDRGIFVNYVRDGMLRVAKRLTIYESPRDRALRMAKRVFGGLRVGQLDTAGLDDASRKFLRETNRLALVDVEGASGFDTGNGHGYFRDSPLVSSDLLATLRYELGPGERGLTRSDESPIWRFPPDYLEKLEAAVFRSDPELAGRAAALATSAR